MEPELAANQDNEEWYDEVYYDTDQDSEEETIGIGLPGQQKVKSGMDSILIKKSFFFFLADPNKI